jgi:asparagine synthase (glutamine-hydrolyzing)
MCGIGGYVRWNGAPEEIAEATRIVDALTCAQAHRGPDDTGVRVIGPTSEGAAIVALGHRRLAIIDLSDAGHQPMSDPHTGNVLVFNGEIYNYRELRAVLIALGSTFTTETDTEVILLAYARWGVDAFLRLRGMFAIALWDAGAERLHVIRDHFGIKPLYYAGDAATSFAFSSEVRPLLASGVVERRLDQEGLRSFLAYGSVQDPLTLVRGIRSLLPGHMLTLEKGTLSISQYWKPDTAHAVPSADRAATLATVHKRLAAAVRSQLVSDVPLGAFLSGGLDSTAIVTLMAEAVEPAKIHTLSVGFIEEGFDESEQARATGERLGVSHRELCLSAEEFAAELPTALAAFDQPSIDGLNTWFVCRLARRAGLTVVLSGVGGDEVFAGYNGFERAIAAERLAALARWVPIGVRRTIGAAVERLGASERWRKFASLITSPLPAYFSVRRLFSDRQIDELVGHESDAHDATLTQRFTKLSQDVVSRATINEISILELQTYVLSTLLRDADQMSMAHSLELRVPFLDVELVETLLTIDGSEKVAPARTKPLLVDALGGRIPDEIASRPKRGFELPITRWTGGALQNEMREVLSNGDTMKFGIAPLEAQRVWRDYERGRVNWSRPWALYVLLSWLDRNRVVAEKVINA